MNEVNTSRLDMITENQVKAVIAQLEEDLQDAISRRDEAAEAMESTTGHQARADMAARAIDLLLPLITD